MNKTVLCKKTSRFPKALYGLTALSLSMALNLSLFASETPVQTAARAGLVPDTVHSILVNKSKTSKKNKVRLYPDANQQVLFFSADGEERKVYQLYLFDMDGKLVHQASIRNHETTVLTNITEGNYLFQVFSNDDRIETGQLNVR
ncbi:T9SS type A sorting domain-containing protein [Flavitalea flava]